MVSGSVRQSTRNLCVEVLSGSAFELPWRESGYFCLKYIRTVYDNDVRGLRKRKSSLGIKATFKSLTLPYPRNKVRPLKCLPVQERDISIFAIVSCAVFGGKYSKHDP
jgi:hypothetical protein